MSAGETNGKAEVGLTDPPVVVARMHGGSGGVAGLRIADGIELAEEVLRALDAHVIDDHIGCNADFLYNIHKHSPLLA